MDHLHVSAIDCVVTVSAMVVGLYLLRIAAAKASASDRPVVATTGQGLGFIVG